MISIKDPILSNALINCFDSESDWNSQELLFRPKRKDNELIYDWGVRIALLNQIDFSSFFSMTLNLSDRSHTKKIVKFYEGLEILTGKKNQIRPYDLINRQDLILRSDPKICTKCFEENPYLRFYWRYEDYKTCHIHDEVLSTIGDLPNFIPALRLSSTLRGRRFSLYDSDTRSLLISKRLQHSDQPLNFETNLCIEIEEKEYLYEKLQILNFIFPKNILATSTLLDYLESTDYKIQDTLEIARCRIDSQLEMIPEVDGIEKYTQTQKERFIRCHCLLNSKNISSRYKSCLCEIQQDINISHKDE